MRLGGGEGARAGFHRLGGASGGERGFGHHAVHLRHVGAGADLLREVHGPARVRPRRGHVVEAEEELGEVVVSDGDLVEVAGALLQPQRTGGASRARR
ncbi:MAG: hypothetical protein R3F14_37935 [Polyangiaceae bacterium]